MTAQLHLLKVFVPYIGGRLEDYRSVRRTLARWCGAGNIEFGMWTRHAPRRADELKGGSVYCVWKGEIRFRLTLRRIVPVVAFRPDLASSRFADHTAIVCRPCAIDVERRPLRMRGFRYLEDEHAPPDVGSAVPPFPLDEIGLVESSLPPPPASIPE